MDSNTSSITIIDANGTTIGTITTSGQTITLAQGDTYTFKPTYATGYTMDTITKTVGSGTVTPKLPNANFVVGTDSATVSVTSRQMLPIQNYNCSNLTNVGDVDMVYDTRDNQAYLIGKLKDGKCWMLEDLNLDGGKALSANDTDVTSAYVSNFTTSNNLTKSGSTIVLPASSTSGFNTINYSYVYNSGNKTNCGILNQSTPCYSYYSWDAATLGSGRSISADNTDAGQSICPKGWKLPRVRSTDASNWQTNNDFYTLAHQYGLDSATSTSESDNGFYTQAGPSTIPNLLLAGRYTNSTFYDGDSLGLYWSSTSFSGNSNAHTLYFNNSSVDSASLSIRSDGLSVRCLLDTTQSTSSTEPESTSEPATSTQAQTSTEPQTQTSTTPPTQTTITHPYDDDDDTTDDESDDPSDTVTDPQGVVTPQNVIEYDGTDLYAPNQNQETNIALAVTAGLATTGVALALFIPKRKKDDENNPTE